MGDGGLYLACNCGLLQRASNISSIEKPPTPQKKQKHKKTKEKADEDKVQ